MGRYCCCDRTAAWWVGPMVAAWAAAAAADMFHRLVWSAWTWRERNSSVS